MPKCSLDLYPFSLAAPPLSVVLVVHPHLVSGSGKDPLDVVLGGVEVG